MKTEIQIPAFPSRCSAERDRCVRGQRYMDCAEYLIDQGKSQQTSFNELHGFGNQRLMIDAATMTENVLEVQMRWELKPIYISELDKVHLTPLTNLQKHFLRILKRPFTKLH